MQNTFKYIYLREGMSRHKLDPKYTGPFKVDRRHGTVVWIWRNGCLEPHKLDQAIAAGQLTWGTPQNDQVATVRSLCVAMSI